MKNYVMLFVLFISAFGFGQNPARYSEIDRKVDDIPSNMEKSTTSIANYISENFTGSQDQIRAVFYWTASNISYDLDEKENSKKPSQSPQEKIAYALKTKKGVCMHYVEVFKDIANKLGIETVSIGGYTRSSNGQIATVSHIWCASKVNGTWYLFDPTWGGGYVNRGRYVPEINNKFYKTDPKVLLASHMPFDYMWQFSEYPITNQEFYDRKTESSDKSLRYDFKSEIENYMSLSTAEQAKATASRIQENGVKNGLIADRLDYENYRVSYEKNKDNFDRIQHIIDTYREAGNQFKDFLSYRNRQFMPLTSDDKIKSKILAPYSMILKCEKEIRQIKDVPKENIDNFNSIKEAIAEAKQKFEKQVDFVNEYLSKDRSERDKMFYKRVVRRI